MVSVGMQGDHHVRMALLDPETCIKCGLCVSPVCPTEAIEPIEVGKEVAYVIEEKCIGCGACVATCKNSSAMLFTSAKVSHLSLLPQGKEERVNRVVNMVSQMDKEGFGNCTNTSACEAECPKEISVTNIARMNREFLKASF